MLDLFNFVDISSPQSKHVINMTAISTLGATASTFLSADKFTFYGYLRALFLGIFVGTLLAMAMYDSGLPVGWQGAIIGISAVNAEYILMGTMTLAKMFRDNPSVVVNFILRRKDK